MYQRPTPVVMMLSCCTLNAISASDAATGVCCQFLQLLKMATKRSFISVSESDISKLREESTKKNTN